MTSDDLNKEIKLEYCGECEMNDRCHVVERDARIAYLQKALSEERARTLNSEAVQEVVDAAKLMLLTIPRNYSSLYREAIVRMDKALEKFQQFKDGKI